METKRTTFDLQPTLKGSLLELRPIHASDLPLLYAVASDPLIWEQHPAKDHWKEDVFRTFFQESLDSGGALMAVDCKLGKVIGSSRFHGYDEQISEIEIGWTFLARSHWGGTYKWRNKRTHAATCLRFCGSRCLSGRSEQPAFAAGSRENRGRCRRFKARWRWSGQHYLRDHHIFVHGEVPYLIKRLDSGTDSRVNN